MLLKAELKDDPPGTRNLDGCYNDCVSACWKIMKDRSTNKADDLEKCKAKGLTEAQGYKRRCCKNNAFCNYKSAKYDIKSGQCVLTF
jgi:hypothetical protein